MNRWLRKVLLIMLTMDSLLVMPQPGQGNDSIGNHKPEIFTNGFIDIMNDGQVNASVRFIRLYIGEQGKWVIPVSLYSGISANNFQQAGVATGVPVNNDHLINQYINPLSGLLNMSSDGVLFFTRAGRVTRPGWLYQFGERLMTGFRAGQLSDPQTGKPVNFLNGFACSGIYIQTGAWDRGNRQNIGICWLVLRYHWCYSNPQQIRELLPGTVTNGVLSGYSMGFGIEITSLVNIKAICYKYLKSPGAEYALPIYQFSFNYSLKN